MERTKERKEHRVHPLFLVLEGLLLLVALPVGAFWLLYQNVRPVTVWELSGDCPPVSALLKGGEGRYASPVEALDWTVPGDQLVLVAGERGIPRVALVRVQDTVAPTARGVSHVLGVDEELTADRFIADLSDKQLVGVAFETAPAFHEAGEYRVVVRLEDLSENVSFVEASCVILGAVPRITIEAGEAVPPLRSFLPNDTVEGRFITDPASIDTAVPGVYTVAVEAEGGRYETALVVEDTVAPVCAFVPMAFTRTGRPLEADSFVSAAEDVTALACRFDPEPDWSRRGYQQVSLVVTDRGGNQARGESTVLVSDLEPLTWEAGRSFILPMEIERRQRALDQSFSGSVRLAFFAPRTPGCYDVNASVDGVMCVQRLYVVDTVAPRIAFVDDMTAYLGHPLSAQELLKTAEDETELTIRYVQEPDWSSLGPQPVSIEAEDLGGNVSRIEGQVNLIEDTVPPQLFGVVNKYVYIGDAVSYFSGVVATDNADKEVTITVDNSRVNIYKAGSYLITYTATDSAGNSSEKSARLVFIKEGISEARYRAAVDKVYAEIIRDNMTLGQKAYAIFTYVKGNFRYNSKSNKYDWKYEAYRGLTKRRGDCYTYCAAARALLEKAGAEVMFVRRYSSSSRHFWLLVNVGTGWYHFDPLNRGPVRKYECFMRTSEEVLGVRASYWRFDQRLYPATPTTPFVRDW